MSADHKQQNWSIPLRVRFRSSAEQAQWEREHSSPVADTPAPPIHEIKPVTNNNGNGMNHMSPPPPSSSVTQAVADSDLAQRTRQIKELIHLGNILRADLHLDEVLQQIVSSISACTGFRSSVINLIQEGSDFLSSAAFAGLSEEDQNTIREAHYPVTKMSKLMRPEYRISQSYFISHEFADDFSEYASVTTTALDEYQPGGWHPDDMFIVPLFSPHKKKLLGFLSLDDPEDGKIPSLESIEVVELFAHQASIAIDNAQLFQEREAEHRALEEAIALLRSDLEQIQRGDLRVRVHSSHEKLRPIGDAINTMLEGMSGILGTVQLVTQAVDEHTRDVQRSSEFLVRDSNHQERQVQHIWLVNEDIAATMTILSENAKKLSEVTSEAISVTQVGQESVLRAVEGMGQVRETTLHSGRVMKRLGESGQEINETITTMTDLTTRMNLLALNAAIEATRAGEHGQGFAVIAQEIRTLAVSSSEAARKIATHIRSIQSQTTTVSQSIDQNTTEVVKQSDIVMQMSFSLEAIGTVTEQMSQLVETVAEASDKQLLASQLVVSILQKILEMTSEISQHMRHMQQSLNHLVELADSLRSRMSVFRIEEAD